MGWLAESRKPRGSHRYGDRVRAVAGWKRHAGVVLSVSAAVAGVVAWAAPWGSASVAVGGSVAPDQHVVIVGIGGLPGSCAPRGLAAPRCAPVRAAGPSP